MPVRSSCGADRLRQSRLEHVSRLAGDQGDHRIGRLVLVQAVLDDQLGQETGVQPAGHVVAGRDRTDRPGVVDEPGEIAQAGDLGHRSLEALDLRRVVQEPPGRPDVHRRVEPGQWGDLPAEHVRVDGEQHQVQVQVGAVSVKQRLQRRGVFQRNRDVVPGIRPEPARLRRMMVPADARVDRHHQAVVAGHAGHLQQHVPAERDRLGVVDLAAYGESEDPSGLDTDVSRWALAVLHCRE